MIDELTPFLSAVEDPAALARSLKKDNRKIIGYLCSYAPEELIFAAGCHPMRLFSSKADIQQADNHLQAYCCSLVRGVLEDGLSGDLDDLDGMVFPHTCDSIQRLSDIWRLNRQSAFFADVIMPVNLTSEASRAYMHQVLKKLKTDLETWTGTPVRDEDLKRSFALFNRIREGVTRIYNLKSRYPDIISGKSMLAVIKGAMIMERSALAGQLERLALALERTRPPETTAKRLILSGSVCDMPDLFTLIEETGGAVVGDDLCSGQRWYEGRIPDDIPPMEGLTARYTDRVVCPAKHSGTTARSTALVNRVREKQADGVVFTLLKFCDPHGFDYPHLAAALDREGIRHIRLELDDGQDGTGQISTRLETFIHMI